MQVTAGPYHLSGVGDVIDDLFASLSVSTGPALQARIQAEVGTFLTLKGQIMQYMNSPNPQIAQKAQELYQTQVSLEGQLQQQMPIVTAIQGGGSYDAGQLTSLGAFAIQMESHISNVHDFLTSAAQGQVPFSLFGLSSNNTLVLAGGAALLAFLYMRR